MVPWDFMILANHDVYPNGCYVPDGVFETTIRQSAGG
jgi:hypothetical protein